MELADALATISSMIQHPKKSYIDPLELGLKEQLVHCSHVEAEWDGNLWYIDVKKYLEAGEYLEKATSIQKKTIRRMENNFFLNGEVLYKRTPDLALLRCVDATEATKLLEEMHARVTRRSDQSTTPWAQCDEFPLAISSLGHGCFGPIEPAASNVHRFSLVAIDYFTKWVEAASYKAMTKKVVADFGRNNLICHFGVPKSIITDNGANLNSHLMKEISEQFKITHRNSTAYHPQMNGVAEVANKNIKRILRKMIDNYKCWHENLPYALLGYRTTIRTSTGATPYLLVYGTEAVIPAEVEIPSLRIIQEMD
ncbi:uncharacterized protein LOC125873928 [Solanum stenotomum]|uniref:uncharacterized protein LOC125873928 n=1 Tax=Solanum stenotomum TaxID=172797 RepID=UPI0020D02106|nr:uncharacterized protein LOC125873928 [Solanum stenotomum]